VTVTLNGETYTATIAGNGTWSVAVGAADLGALTDGQTYAVTASVVDKSGNPASAMASVTVDESATVSIAPIDGNNFVNVMTLTTCDIARRCGLQRISGTAKEKSRNVVAQLKAGGPDKQSHANACSLQRRNLWRGNWRGANADRLTLEINLLTRRLNRSRHSPCPPGCSCHPSAAKVY
jgi:hypothetical protein